MAATLPQSVAGTGAGIDQDPADYGIRELEEAADYEACAGLQRRVWGEGYRDIVPGSLIKVSREVGGLCAGAFSPAGDLIGFVYGLTGVRSGRVVHWSHMLAVDPAYRNCGVGRRLKLYQRKRLGVAGVSVMFWTFDPLVARNAHLNLNRLGVVIEAYEPDMYPGTGSDLHAFGTDRLVASWSVFGQSGGRTVGPGDVSAIGVWRGKPPSAGQRAIRVEIPVDAESMRAGALDDLREWRRSTRSAFMSLLGAGWMVTGFQNEGERRHYVLERPG
jgi:predicted GNAT superfamily acetyltransferase